jgi:hypothetical protein
MPQVGIEPMIPVFEPAKTLHALDRAATMIGLQLTGFVNLLRFPRTDRSTHISEISPPLPTSWKSHNTPLAYPFG